jgi:hypothetical protein
MFALPLGVSTTLRPEREMHPMSANLTHCMSKDYGLRAIFWYQQQLLATLAAATAA